MLLQDVCMSVEMAKQILKHFYRATHMHSVDYAVARCLSVCLSHAGVVPKRLYISSKFFTIG